MTRVDLITGQGHAADAAVMLAELKGRMSQEQPDEAETKAFCSRLNGITFRSYAANLARPDLTPLPPGHRNLRIHDAGNGSMLGSVWWIGSADAATRSGAGFRTVNERPTARNVAAVLLSMVFDEIVEWRSTIAATSRDPGVLDLLVDIDTRPRELLWDGSALPEHLVAFLASRTVGNGVRSKAPS